MTRIKYKLTWFHTKRDKSLNVHEFIMADAGSSTLGSDYRVTKPDPIGVIHNGVVLMHVCMNRYTKTTSLML